jgi:nitroreductase
MNISDAIRRRRTIRRYKQKPVEDKLLLELIDSARFAPSASNMQQLRYVIIRNQGTVQKVFLQTAWGGSVRPKRSPEWLKDAPQAFIAVMAPAESLKKLKHIHADAGAAIQNILLKAVELGLGTCWIGSFKEEVNSILELGTDTAVVYLVAVGYPDEEPVQEDIAAGVSTKYYLDDKDVLHVPKFKADAITQWK